MSTPSEPEPSEPINYTAFTITSVVLLIFFTISIYVVLPKNVLSSPALDPVRPEFSSFWPQGWGFFTKDPDSSNLDAYHVNDSGDLESLLVTPQGLPSNLLGLSRVSRAQGPEIAFLHSNIDTEDWIECEGGNNSCLADALKSPTVDVANAAPHPTVCGEVLLTQETPTPWAYRELVAERFKVTHAVHVQVQCSEEQR